MKVAKHQWPVLIVSGEFNLPTDDRFRLRIPIMMGGEVMNEKAKPIFEYLKLRQEFEDNYPGYKSDIHGMVRTELDGREYFKTLCIKQ